MTVCLTTFVPFRLIEGRLMSVRIGCAASHAVSPLPLPDRAQFYKKLKYGLLCFCLFLQNKKNIFVMWYLSNSIKQLLCN